MRHCAPGTVSGQLLGQRSRAQVWCVFAAPPARAGEPPRVCTVGGRGPLYVVGADALWHHILAMGMAPDGVGISWLELAVDFRLSHPGVALLKPARGAAPTMLQEMEAFRARASVLVGQHMHPEVQTLFRPAVGRCRPLARLGITSTSAAVSFRPCWEAQRWARLDDFLLKTWRERELPAPTPLR